MSDITNRWDGDYYLTYDQYEGTKKYFENRVKDAVLQVSPRTSTTCVTSTNDLICDPNSTTFQLNPSTDVNSTTKIGSLGTINSHVTSCGPTCLSDIVGRKDLGFRNIKIKRIIFNPPATVIIWGDDTKTVVKCAEDDEFNPEIGVAMCYMKKIHGSRHAFSKMVESYIEE